MKKLIFIIFVIFAVVIYGGPNMRDPAWIGALNLTQTSTGENFWPTNTTSATNVFYYLGNDSTADGSAVLSWTDLSGNGWHLTNGSANLRPTNILNQINGHAVVRFDGVDDTLTNILSFDRSTNVGTIMVVAGRLTDTTAGAVGGMAGVRMITWFPDVQTIYSDANDVFGVTVSNWVNGAFTKVFPASPAFALVTQTNVGSPPILGQFIVGNSGVNGLLKGDVAFLAGWNGGLSVFERRRIETNVCAYFGLTIQP